MTGMKVTQTELINRGLRAISLELIDVEPRERPSPDGLEMTLDVTAAFNSIGKIAGLVIDAGLLAQLQSFQTPLEAATWFINAKYAAIGGANSILGATVGAIKAGPLGGFERRFQQGAILWHADWGAHVLRGPIFVRWIELGGAGGFLGYPTSDVAEGRDSRREGLFAHFAGGSIYWAPPTPPPNNVAVGIVSATMATRADIATKVNLPDTAPVASTGRRFNARSLSVTTTRDVAINAATEASAPERVFRADAVVDVAAVVNTLFVDMVSSTGAFEIHGAIRERYLALGAEASVLGYPRTDETATPDGRGRYNHFQGGSIYWSNATSAYEVHGLIRSLWAERGWEQSSLGYPVSDELIPDRRIGNRRPETFKKPIGGLAIDVVKLPIDAIESGVSPLAINLPPQPRSVGASTDGRSFAAPDVTARTGVGNAAAADMARSTLGALGPLTTVAATTNIVSSGMALDIDASRGTVFNPVSPVGALPLSTAAPDQSRNRFADFENGVLFWRRGAAKAAVLGPTNELGSNIKVRFTPAEITDAVLDLIGAGVFTAGGTQVHGATFDGVTPYRYDGVQSRNRRHRIRVGIHGPGQIGANNQTFGIVEIEAEVAFDPLRRAIMLMLTSASLTSVAGASVPPGGSAVLAALDSFLWRGHELVRLPDTDDRDAFAVLSVKTMPDGSVLTFVEPDGAFALTDFVLPGVFLQPALATTALSTLVIGG